MDLKAYQSQIKELIPLRQTPDFNELLDKILFGESNSDKFLIKMEINRLAKPCQRLIDLRDKVTEACTLFEIEGTKHYLTKATIPVLKDNIALYGLYTVGAFEAVHEFVSLQKSKLNKQNEIKKPKQTTKEQCEYLTLSQKNKRGAPRMFFVSEVLAETNDGLRFKAYTSNISVTGVKIKLEDDIRLANDELVSITFTGLALEYHDKVLSQAIQYRLVKQENDIDNHSYFYLNYHDSNDTFKSFISDFIRINQYKYKIDVHYYYQLAKISALKHSYLNGMAVLPIYLNEQSPTPLLFTLNNNTNNKISDAWQCDQIDQLPLLFDELRFVKLIAQMSKQQATTVYTFTHNVQGKQYFLSATEEELLEKGLKQLFINCGRSKVSWRVYHLTLRPLKYTSSTEQDITEPTPAIFKKVTHLATLQQLTKAYPFDINTKLDNNDVNQLNQFVHRASDSKAKSKSFTLFSKERRKEERYLYKSEVKITDKKNNFSGHLIDFSLSGLKVKLKQISAFPIGAVLKISFTELQKISKSYPLKELKYRVIKTSPSNILHLQVCQKKSLEICQHFFSTLVKNNEKHFTCIPLQGAKQPTSKHLVDIAEESFLNAVFFISKIANKPTIKFSAIDSIHHSLHKLFSLKSDTPYELNFYPLANNQLYERLVIEQFKDSEEKMVRKEALIYVNVVRNSEGKWHIESFLDDDFNSEKAKVNFIKESQFTGGFYALHYRLTSLPSVDINTIKSEIRAISRFAIHLTKKLEEELKAVEGMIEITDRTEEIINAVNNRS
ncbi:hypothetical protein CW745_14120 [Psychromonas sp. psych-6C06]|uniref:PilZ domain-containing protein n=1 Tax=Psychromonas sp. psych-6C06 TaxID=2058089 RepID=UPI000C324458|nr:PilZ domain-containing protein [Psychromonas sp. psych-6C06]PKF60662.1 hypothetical protein CW745_14120 [Psychromonas sp. psych-6C06]